MLGLKESKNCMASWLFSATALSKKSGTILALPLDSHSHCYQHCTDGVVFTPLTCPIASGEFAGISCSLGQVIYTLLIDGHLRKICIIMMK